MGIDINTHFGKIGEKKTLDFHRRFADEEIGNPFPTQSGKITLMERFNINPGDIVLGNPQGPADGHRDSHLFSFLYFGWSMQPMIPIEADLEFRKKRSIEFAHLLEDSVPRFSLDDDFLFFFSEQVVIYTVEELTSFNYDEVAVVDNGADFDAVMIKHPEGKTYRELLPEVFFITLKEAEDNGWGFLVFSFG